MADHKVDVVCPVCGTKNLESPETVVGVIVRIERVRINSSEPPVFDSGKGAEHANQVLDIFCSRCKVRFHGIPFLDEERSDEVIRGMLDSEQRPKEDFPSGLPSGDLPGASPLQP